jgi:hypothetical protein
MLLTLGVLAMENIGHAQSENGTEKFIFHYKVEGYDLPSTARRRDLIALDPDTEKPTVPRVVPHCVAPYSTHLYLQSKELKSFSAKVQERWGARWSPRLGSGSILKT